MQKTDKTVILKHSEKIIGLRNRIVHAYDNINYDIIWGIIKNHIPVLKVEVQTLLNKE